MDPTFKPTVAIALLGFVPLALAVFALVPARRAVAWVFVSGWLFLPSGANYPLPGFPDWNKYSAVTTGALLGALIFDLGRVLSFRPKWFDLPVLLLIVAPFMASITNDLGAYDGLSSVHRWLNIWVIPYFLARVYFSDLAGARDLAIIFVLGALVYVPLCLIEVRLSPQLNIWVYGYHQHEFAQSRRYGGYRPTVFMNHGLMVGLWMCAGALIATMLWLGRSVRSVAGLPIGLVAMALAITAVLCKSFGALALLALGLALGALARQLRWAWVIVLLAAIPLLYVLLRATQVWDGQELIDISTALGGTERGGSLWVRLRNENVLIAKALQQPMFGWGGYGRNRPDGTEISWRIVTDGLWVIILGQQGLVGLAGMLAMFNLPVVLFLNRWRSLAVLHPWLTPSLALCIVVSMFMCDALFNGQASPLYTLAAGSLAGLRADPRLIALMRSHLVPRAHAGSSPAPQSPQSSPMLPPR